MGLRMRRRRRVFIAGERKSADQIIAAAMKWNCVVLGGLVVLAALAGLLPLFGVAKTAAFSFAISIIAVAASNLLSWAFYVHIARQEMKFQGVATTFLFLMKLLVLLLLVFAAKNLEIIQFGHMLTGFACGIVISLIVSAAVVMGQPGPPLEMGSNAAKDSLITNR
ncbi:putative integral membrane protein [Arcanobacterium pluranimalium]|uniref:hypothetical protein n=1 Tax=Arcanobacterium pluranimalium TaxID=108028 RepID=UPI00195932A4|nr:hypothetical protein [Arcanobacterium pluranimalium]MBM7825839.1 putative integral membrane protein [Arcanobacterium pluranimalium]